MLTKRYGEKVAARMLSRILGATVDHGEELVAGALQAALSRGKVDVLELSLVLRYKSVLMPHYTFRRLRYVFVVLRGKAPSLRFYERVTSRPTHCYVASARSGGLLEN
jgi:hypothetical protein